MDLIEMSSIDLSLLDEDSLLDLFSQMIPPPPEVLGEKSTSILEEPSTSALQVAHAIFCLNHPKIPNNFSNIFVTLIDKMNAVADIELSQEKILHKELTIKVYIESIYSDLRAIFLENEENFKNYTLVNSVKLTQGPIEKKLAELNFKDDIGKINEILSEKRFSDKNIKDKSFRDLIKLITNKTIAHKDEINEKNINIIEKRYDFLKVGITKNEVTSYIYDIHAIYEEVVFNYAKKRIFYRVVERLTS